MVGTSHHYTAENIRALVAEYKALEAGGPDTWDLHYNTDHRARAGVLWRVISALADEVPFAAAPTPAAQAAECVPAVDKSVMELAESVCLIGPTSRIGDLHAAIQRFHDLICVNATIKAATMAAEVISSVAMPDLQDAVVLLRKYRRLCKEVGRGDSAHIDRIEAAAVAVQTVASRAPADSQPAPPPPPECETEAEKRAFAFGWFKALESERMKAESVLEDAALWHWLAEYLVGPRTDLDDEIVASETVNDLRKLVKAAIKQGEKQ